MTATQRPASRRFVGWVSSIVGAGIIVAWLTLPVERAERICEGLILATVLLAMARKLHSVATHHRQTAHERSGG